MNDGWLAWIGVRDPSGMVHMLGDVDGDVDLTECGREFATVDGWRGVNSDVEAVCAKCVEANIAAYQKRSSIRVTSNGAPITIKNCKFV